MTADAAFPSGPGDASSRVEQAQGALYRIAELAADAQDLQEFYRAAHAVVGGLMDATNFFIALYDAERLRIQFPYFVDAVDPDIPDPNHWENLGEHLATGTTAYMLRTGEAQLVTYARALELAREGELEIQGADTEDSIWLGVPLRAEGQTIGALVVQSYTKDVQYTEDDKELLQHVGHHVGAALSRVRAIEETRRRNAELAVLSSVQEALGGELELQAIYDLVGDKLRDIFDAQVIDIGVHDEASGLLHFPYSIERGVRFPDEPIELIGFRGHVIETRRPLLIDEDVRGATERFGNPVLGSGELPKSVLYVPLIAGGRAKGVISLQNFDREHAFTESDQQLLQTLVRSLGSALENARLVHETRQRNAELTLINSVQESIAGELELQAIYDLVGDRIQEVFDAQVVDIRIYDAATGLMHTPYAIERGVRYPDEPVQLSEGGFSRYVMETGESVFVDENIVAACERYGIRMRVDGSGEMAKSVIFVPLGTGSRPTGVVSIQNLDREHAFTDSDHRLLATLVGSLSAALENARLIEETRQRVSELATVNSVGQALAAHLELGVLIELVGDRVRETFAADIAYVALHDEAAGRIDFVYYFESGERRPEPSLEYGQGLTSQIIASREPLLLNREEQYEGRNLVGTRSRSYLGVPIVVGGKAIGAISVQSIEEGGRFGEVETGLLATIAANVGIAIQNARLFEEQRAAERQYRELVEQLPMTVYRDLPDSTATSEYISPRVETMTGYSPEAWMRPEFFESVLHPDDRERILADEEWLEESLDRWSSEYRVIAADGRTVWLRDDAWIVKDEEGKPFRIHGFMMDITEQKLAEQEIRRQKQYFESLVDVSPVAIVVMDAAERVTGWNPAATELFGWTTEEALGSQIDDLVFEEGAAEEGREVTDEALERGRAQRIGRRARKDAGVVDVELMLVPLRVDGEHVGFYAIYHDITELQRAREEAETATQAKSAFLATMSHEIRTPMNAVIGMTGLLLGTELSAEQREFAEIVRSSGDALLHVIDDILDYSKIEAGKLELEKAPVDLRECVEGALEIVAPRAWEKEIELGCLIDDGVPAGIVGDAGRLRQVLLNLLSNAVKFTEEGEVVVHVDAQRTRTGSYRLHLAVRDTGIGIPQDRMDRLFASFSQVDASTSRRYGGTGLGLAISKRLVELMRGTMSAESEEGKGSTFHIELTAKEAEIPARIAAPDGLPQLAGKRILVVDDNATNREIVARHARSWGLDPVAIATPADALARIDEGEKFDVAVLDMVMPEMDGLTLATELRRRRDERELPLVLLTSLGRLPQTQSSGEFVVQLAKPVRASQLYNALLKALAGQVQELDAPGESVLEEDKAMTSSLRILLAEDNAVNQKVALRLLERLGYEADVASNGFEALEALERQPYDVVLMDVQMPELDGLDASRGIHQRFAPDVRPRIIAMTANAMPEDREACMAAGMDDYVAKPIRPEELAKALGRVTPRR